MNIRVLTESDAQLYQEFRLRALKTNPEAFGSTYEREEKFSLETIKERLRSSEDKFVLGSFDEHDLLAGMVVFMRENGVKTAHKGSVYGLYVDPTLRGKGIGKSLLLELIKKAKKCSGLEQINLTVVSQNRTAKKLYKSLGFEIFCTERNALKYNGEYFDEDLMAFNLPKTKRQF